MSESDIDAKSASYIEALNKLNELRGTLASVDGERKFQRERLKNLGEEIADELAGRGVARATLVNPRRATAPEADLVAGLSRDHRLVVTLEDGVVDGGFGERCARILAREGGVRVRCYGLPCAFPDRYDPASLLESCGMTVEGVCDDVERALGR